MTLVTATCPSCHTVSESEQATRGGRRRNYMKHAQMMHPSLTRREQGEIADAMLRSEVPGPDPDDFDPNEGPLS